MKLTHYGLFSGIGVLISLSIIRYIDFKLALIFILAITAQTKISSKNESTYSLISYLSIIPILVIIFNKCYRTKELLVGASIMLAVGRIGCYYAGCCSGKIAHNHSYFNLSYNKNKYIDKDTKVTVYPTIIIEIVIQFLIAFIIYKSDYAIVWFGILNAVLAYFTTIWRKDERINTVSIPIASLLLVSLIGYLKCGQIKNYKLKVQLSWWMFIFVIMMSLIVSNDINVKSFKTN